jgi:hypothetical protein
MLRGLAVSDAAAGAASASAQGDVASASASPHDPTAVASNGAGVQADANLDWDVDKGDDDVHSTGQAGARNLGSDGGEPDFSAKLDKDFPDGGAAPSTAPPAKPAGTSSISMAPSASNAPPAATAPPSAPRRL